jgi:hypothetical protein
MANISIKDLSTTISELVDLDLEQQHAIESALNRAVTAKDIAGGFGVPTIAGGIFPMPTTDDSLPNPSPWRKTVA